ncbi:pre-mRNA-splicing factor SLU7, partial [Aplysia californica]|uniref:Pre-mRNA-splicing factor SLU7 n=1 Tax=Aplysia californica TaxID=6500 RepID=A0ABM1A0H5_APLCA
MSFQLNMPPSAVARKLKQEQGEDGDEPRKQSREEWKKERELEEMRKAGTAPAMKDEEGKDINPHIPQYIMQAPWYFGAETATLKHQRQQDEKVPKYDPLNVQLKKGVKEGPVAVKFRKGACANCGAMTHKKKDCLERPRKVGAKFTGAMIAPDEHVIPQLKMNYEGKRDMWNNFDAEEHQKRLQDEYKEIEEAKRALKEKSLDESLMTGKGPTDAENGEAASDGEDEDKHYTEEMDMPGQKFETKQRITVRNLRIREDTAKYLYNLDPNSAYYDPKTRSMRENPLKNTSKEDITELKFGGDNFVRFSGDAQEMAKRQLFAWEAYERGNDIHLQADPTKLELLHKEFERRKGDFKQTAKDSILDKYGGQEYLEAPPKQLLLAQTEDYVEYSRTGAVIKGQERAQIKSRYEEDVYPNNHTSVWGSYWKDGRWGFACCHSFIKESYCTGEAGKQAELESNLLVPVATQVDTVPETLLEKHQKKLKEGEKKKRKKKSSKSSSSSSSSSSATTPASTSSSKSGLGTSTGTKTQTNTASNSAKPPSGVQTSASSSSTSANPPSSSQFGVKSSFASSSPSVKPVNFSGVKSLSSSSSPASGNVPSSASVSSSSNPVAASVSSSVTPSKSSSSSSS